ERDNPNKISEDRSLTSLPRRSAPRRRRAGQRSRAPFLAGCGRTSSRGFHLAPAAERAPGDRAGASILLVPQGEAEAGAEKEAVAATTSRHSQTRGFWGK